MSYLEKNIRFIGSNHKVSYYDEGADNAPVIILIHGFPFNKSMWKKQIDLLIDNSRVIAYDIRGHGNSDAGNEEFTIDLFVKDLLLLMDTLKIEQATLCGLSMGGYIALNAIENYPYCFNALILSDTHCIADTPEVKEKRMKAIRNIQENGVEQFAADMINSLFASESLITKKNEMAMVRTMITNTAVQTLVKTLHALSNRKETCSKLPEIKVPALIMVGIEDKITPPTGANFMHRIIKNSLFSLIDNAGHLSNLENPDHFNDQLRKFVMSVNEMNMETSGVSSKC